MPICFIKENKEKNSFKLIFGKIKQEKIDNNNLILLPMGNNNKIYKRRIKQAITIIQNQSIKSVVLSNYLANILVLKSELLNNGISIIDGTILLKMLLNEILEYICITGKTSMEKLKISIITNNISNTNKQTIIELANKVKTINIVTQNQRELKKIEEYLYNEMGIILKLSHNIDKTCNIIINLDNNQEELNKYNIPSNSIIININGNIKINAKKFSGININSYNIEMPNKYKIQDFEDKLAYESLIIGKEYNQIRKQIKEDKIQIKNLIGEKGIINDKEFIIFS